jgi:hypothetical protein
MLELTENNRGQHYVIGHSHGALVALYALRDASLAQRIEGVVSLSTPYLVARERELSVLGWAAACLGTLSAVWICLQLTKLPFATYLDAHGPWYIGVAAFLLGFVLQMSCLAAPGGVLLGMLKLTEWFLETLAIPEIHSERLLVVRRPSDEASALITLFHALELLVTAVWGRRGPFDRLLTSKVQWLLHATAAAAANLPQALIRVFVFWTKIGAPLIIVTSLTAAIVLFNHPENFDIWKNAGWSRSLPLWLAAKSAYFYFSTYAPFWLLALAGVIAFPAFALVNVFGLLLSIALTVGLVLGAAFFVAVLCTAILALTSVPELGQCVATVVVSAEAAPPGSYTIVHTSGRTSESDGFLLHSWSYTRDEALAAIVKWFATPKPAGQPLVRLRDPQPPSGARTGSQRPSGAPIRSRIYRSVRR